MVIVVRAQALDAACPDCRRRSTAVHSTYVRHPADLPSLGRGVRLAVRVRRFYCRTVTCVRRTFAEAFRGLLDRRAQRTRRLAAAQQRVAVQVGGEAAARLLTGLAMPTSADSLLRLVRRAPLAVRRTPRVLGVDDWALKRGRTYGTILVDLEARHVVDLLPDRTAPTLAAWLRPRPPIWEAVASPAGGGPAKATPHRSAAAMTRSSGGGPEDVQLAGSGTGSPSSSKKPCMRSFCGKKTSRRPGCVPTLRNPCGVPAWTQTLSPT